MIEMLTPLIEEEKEVLAGLLRRLKPPYGPKVFPAWVQNFITTPVEMAVFNNDQQILLVHREDSEYKGWHSPGTILRDEENVPAALQRLIAGELGGAEVTKPVSLGWVEVPRGNGPGQNPTRHEISLLHACWLYGTYKGGGSFFDSNNLPKETLTHHKMVIIPEIFGRLSAKTIASF